MYAALIIEVQMVGNWPQTHAKIYYIEVYAERKKKVITVMSVFEQDELWFSRYFFNYNKIIRMNASMYRFVNNVKHKDNKIIGELTSQEYLKTETLLILLVQKQYFTKDDKRVNQLNVFKDEKDVFRLRTRVSNREDSKDFKFPILLPSNHIIV